MNNTHILSLPPRSKILVVSDVHIPNHDERSLRLVVECAEYEGVTHTLPNGDLADSGVASRHPGKRSKDAINFGTLKRSMDKGRWFVDFLRTRPCTYMLGNHEKWIDDAIKSDPMLVDTLTVPRALGLPEDGDGWTVLGPEKRLRLGSLVIEHGHGIFPSGSGGSNPGQRIRSVAPNQSTLIGHLHRDFQQVWTTQDIRGVPQTHIACGTGHLSMEESHADYAGGYTGWQKSFAIIETWTEGTHPRFTITRPLILTDGRGRPYFQLNGKVYK